MKRIVSLLLFSLVAFCAGCATLQVSTDVSAGRQALFAGNYPSALGYFQAAEETNPNYIYGTELREGVYSYLGRAQYLTGRLPQARQSLDEALSRHHGDFVARLYLGLTLARLGDRQAGLKDIENGMKAIYNFLNYLEQTFSYSFGQYWDPGGQIRASIKGYLSIISSGNIDWPQLIADGESLGIRIEEEEDKARMQQQQQQQMQFQR
jgi:tetratricopeptide (TPR) repeat protein